jgi:hypothetical protein
MDEIGMSFDNCSKHGKSIHMSKLKTICIIMIKGSKQQPMLFITHLFDEGNAFIIIFSNKKNPILLLTHIFDELLCKH